MVVLSLEVTVALAHRSRATTVRRHVTAALVSAALCVHAASASAAPEDDVDVDVEIDAAPADPPKRAQSEPDADDTSDGRAYRGATEISADAQEHAAFEAELEAMRRRIEELERDAAEAKRAPPAPAPRPEHDPRSLRVRLGALDRASEVGFGRLVGPTEYGVYVGGWLQAQYLWSQLSEDQLQQGGRALNRDGFAVRRGRFRIGGDWRFVAFAFEMDASTTRGPFVGVRQAHMSAMWRNPKSDRPPYVMVTAGLTEVPFGYELRRTQRDMIFMERSTGSLALFPGPVDVGLRVRGGIRAFRYDVAVMNGSPLPDVAGVTPRFDPTRRPDVMGRLGFEVGPRGIELGGGASFLTGTGLHEGQDATKNTLQWHDLNENGTVETGEIFSVPGTAALPSVRFSRWAVNADLHLAVRSRIGRSRVLAEATLAENLDRGFFVADPFAAGAGIRHMQAYAAVLQDVTRWAIVGLRYDIYDFDSDLLSRRGGRAVPADSNIHTFSPLVGAVLPGGIVPGVRGRIVFQYDVVLDALGRDARGVPTNLRNDQLTVRAHVEF